MKLLSKQVLQNNSFDMLTRSGVPAAEAEARKKSAMSVSMAAACLTSTAGKKVSQRAERDSISWEDSELT